LSRQRQPLEATEANTAVFYSNSNCQTGLRGVSFGNFLIKQIVEDLRGEYGNLTNFVTLSPLPGFCRWIEALSADEWVRHTSLGKNDAITVDSLPDHPEALLTLAAHYLARAKSSKGLAKDPVAHFHLGNGARLESIHIGADLSERGLATSFGLMANYLYTSDYIEQNHEHYVQDATVICSSQVQSMLR
jgi:malonyl-CoA decarboxylase